MTLRFAKVLAIPAALASTLLLQTVAMASAPDAGTQPTEQLDEFVVRANHLWQIRRAIVETEDRFYARYNQLNRDDDFDVHCARSAPLGTRIASRRCEVAFYENAQQQAVIYQLGGPYAPDPELVRLERLPDYRRNALQVINSDPQLRKLARRREDLEKLYFRRQKEIFADRWIDW